MIRFSKFLIQLLILSGFVFSPVSKTKASTLDTSLNLSLIKLGESTPAEVNWRKLSLAEAANLAEKEKKQILVYFTASWCGPCHVMDREVFSQSNVISAINKQFVAVKIDIDSWAMQKWRSAFPISMVPNFFILGSDQQKLKHHVGSVAADKFIEFLQWEPNEEDKKLTNARSVRNFKEKWNQHVGVGLAMGISQIQRFDVASRFAYEFSASLNFTKKRFSFSPALSYARLGTSTLALNYLKIPLQAGINYYRGSFLGIPGGLTASIAPYYACLLNHSAVNLNRNDVGLAYGLGIYIGGIGSSTLLFSLRYHQGLVDVLNLSGRQTNQFFGAGLNFYL